MGGVEDEGDEEESDKGDGPAEPDAAPASAALSCPGGELIRHRWKGLVWVKINATDSIGIRVSKIIHLRRLLRIAFQESSSLVMVTKSINPVAKVFIEITICSGHIVACFRIETFVAAHGGVKSDKNQAGFRLPGESSQGGGLSQHVWNSSNECLWR